MGFETEKLTMVWSRENGGRSLSAKVGRANVSAGEKGKLETKETWINREAGF